MKGYGQRIRTESEGFSLLEVLAVLLLAALVATLAVPGFKALAVTSEENAEARKIYALLRTARWKAVFSGRRTRLLTFGSGDGRVLSYALQREEEGRWIPDGQVHLIPSALLATVTGPAAKVFNPRGTSSFGSLTLRGGSGTGYRLSLNPATGRVRFWRGAQDVHDGP